MKKILIVNIGTEIGGIEKCLINFLHYLVDKNCTIDVTFWKPDGPLFSQIPKGVNVLPNRGVGSFKSVLKSKNPKKFIDYIRFKVYSKKGIPWKSLPVMDTEYDLAISYCQNGYSPYFVIDNVKAKEKMLWYHELDYRFDDDKKAFDEQYFSQYTKICAVSDACKNNLSKRFPKLKDKIYTIYNLYNTNEITEKSEFDFDGYNTDKSVVATVGRLSSEKGVELAINACKELSKSIDDFVWYWIGDGDMRQKAQQLIDEMNLSNKFVLLGNKTNPYPYIKNCHIYVQPSLSEAFCTTIIEAKILAKPIVSTDVDSVFEQLQDGVNGLICKKDASSLASSIAKMISDNQLKQQFTDNLSAYSINDYSAYDKLIFNS